MRFRQNIHGKAASIHMSVAIHDRPGAGAPGRSVPPSAQRLAAVRERLAHRIELSEDYCRRFGLRRDQQPLSNTAMDRIFDYADRLASDAESHMPEEMWRRLVAEHTMLTDISLRRDKAAFGTLMQTIAQTPMVTGMTEFGHDELAASAEARTLEATLFVDRLVSLLAFLELIPVPIQSSVAGSFATRSLKL